MDKKIRSSSVKALEHLNDALLPNNYYDWGHVVELLEKKFNWTPKTSSNRIHELIEFGFIQRVGIFEKPTPRRKGGKDRRQVRIISRLNPSKQSNF